MINMNVTVGSLSRKLKLIVADLEQSKSLFNLKTDSSSVETNISRENESHMQSKIEDLNLELQKRDNIIQAKEEMIETLKEEMSNNSIQERESIIEHLQSKLMYYMEYEKSFEDISISIKEEVSQLEELKANFQKDYNEVLKKQCNIRQTISRLEEQLEESKSLLLKKDETITMLSEQLENLESALKEQIISGASLKEKLMILEKYDKIYSDKISSMQTEKEEMRKCLLENKELLEKYAQEVTNLKTQQHPMKEETPKTQNMIDFLATRFENMRLQEERYILQQKIVRIEQTIELAEEAVGNKNILTDQLEELKEIKKELQKKIDNQNSEIEKLNKELIEVKDLLNQKNEEIEKIQNQKNLEIDDLRLKLQELQQKVLTENNTLLVQQREIDALENQLDLTTKKRKAPVSPIQVIVKKPKVISVTPPKPPLPIINNNRQPLIQKAACCSLPFYGVMKDCTICAKRFHSSCIKTELLQIDDDFICNECRNN